MDKAIHAVEVLKWTEKRAAAHNNVPYTTLRDKIRKLHPGKVGRPTVLSKQTEDMLADFAITVCEGAEGMTKDEFLEVVKKSCEDNPEAQFRFTNGKPGEKWGKNIVPHIFPTFPPKMFFFTWTIFPRKMNPHAKSMGLHLPWKYGPGKKKHLGGKSWENVGNNIFSYFFIFFHIFSYFFITLSSLQAATGLKDGRSGRRRSP